jgi:hypothetical protein
LSKNIKNINMKIKINNICPILMNSFLDFLREVIGKDYALLSCHNKYRGVEAHHLILNGRSIISDLVDLTIFPARLANYMAESTTVSLRIYKGDNHYQVYSFKFFFKKNKGVIQTIPAYQVKQIFRELDYCQDENIEFLDKSFF